MLSSLDFVFTLYVLLFIAILFSSWTASTAYVYPTCFLNLEHLIVSCPSAPSVLAITSLFVQSVCWVDCDVNIDWSDCGVSIVYDVFSYMLDRILLVLFVCSIWPDEWSHYRRNQRSEYHHDVHVCDFQRVMLLLI